MSRALSVRTSTGRQPTTPSVTRSTPSPVLPPLVRQLLDSIEPSDIGDEIYALALGAELFEAPAVDPDAAERVVARFRWLIEQVGREGVQLTAAGYLPPALVKATIQELRLELWAGKGNREDRTPPVAVFRRAAQELGVVRKVKGRLVVPAKVHAAAPDAVKLWEHLVERLPLGRYASVDRFVAVLTLVWLAAGREPGTEAFYGSAKDALMAAGWRRHSGQPLDRDDAWVLARPLLGVLDAAGCAAAFRGRRKAGRRRRTRCSSPARSSSPGIDPPLVSIAALQDRHLGDPPDRGRLERHEMNGTRVVLDGLGFPESTRWHDGRVWLCNWGSGEVLAVTPDGKPEVAAAWRRGHCPSASTGSRTDACSSSTARGGCSFARKHPAPRSTSSPT